MTIKDMMDMQRRLQEKWEGVWEGDHPETARNHLLYAVEEVGEVAAILKKRKEDAVLHDPEVRAHFCEEMGDVFMYLTDVMCCFDITPEEFERAYLAKVEKNMGRNFVEEHSNYLKK